jgi:diaminopimelate decarboxylase
VIEELMAELSEEFFGLERAKNLEFFLTQLTQKYACPVYLISLEILKKRSKKFERVLKAKLPNPLHFHFAMKSNFHPRVLQEVKRLGFGLDVVSGGELQRALQCGFSGLDIVYSGVAKSRRDLELALVRSPVGQINVESVPELSRILSICKEHNSKAKIGLRFNPEVKAETHPAIATGFREHKFGLGREDLLEAAQVILKNPETLQYQGLSLHIGSQLTDFKAHAEALQKALELDYHLAKLGLSSQSLDVGGGVGVNYNGTEEDDFSYLETYASVLAANLKGFFKPIQFEPGRFWVARAGVLITQVEYVKRTPYKNFLILNAGMNALLRPMLYQAYHPMQLIPLHNKGLSNLTPHDKGSLEVFDVVGPVCESTDVLGALREFRSPKEGDVLLVGLTGAYGAVLQNQYNLLPEVPELILEDL